MSEKISIPAVEKDPYAGKLDLTELCTQDALESMSPEELVLRLEGLRTWKRNNRPAPENSVVPRPADLTNPEKRALVERQVLELIRDLDKAVDRNQLDMALLYDPVERTTHWVPQETTQQKPVRIEPQEGASGLPEASENADAGNANPEQGATKKLAVQHAPDTVPPTNDPVLESAPVTEALVADTPNVSEHGQRQDGEVLQAEIQARWDRIRQHMQGQVDNNVLTEQQANNVLERYGDDIDALYREAQDAWDQAERSGVAEPYTQAETVLKERLTAIERELLNPMAEDAVSHNVLHSPQGEGTIQDKVEWVAEKRSALETLSSQATTRLYQDTVELLNRHETTSQPSRLEAQRSGIEENLGQLRAREEERRASGAAPPPPITPEREKTPPVPQDNPPHLEEGPQVDVAAIEPVEPTEQDEVIMQQKFEVEAHAFKGKNADPVGTVVEEQQEKELNLAARVRIVLANADSVLKVIHDQSADAVHYDASGRVTPIRNISEKLRSADLNDVATHDAVERFVDILAENLKLERESLTAKGVAVPELAEVPTAPDVPDVPERAPERAAETPPSGGAEIRPVTDEKGEAGTDVQGEDSAGERIGGALPTAPTASPQQQSSTTHEAAPNPAVLQRDAMEDAMSQALDGAKDARAKAALREKKEAEQAPQHVNYTTYNIAGSVGAFAQGDLRAKGVHVGSAPSLDRMTQAEPRTSQPTETQTAATQPETQGDTMPEAAQPTEHSPELLKAEEGATSESALPEAEAPAEADRSLTPDEIDAERKAAETDDQDGQELLKEKYRQDSAGEEVTPGSTEAATTTPEHSEPLTPREAYQAYRKKLLTVENEYLNAIREHTGAKRATSKLRFHVRPGQEKKAKVKETKATMEEVQARYEAELNKLNDMRTERMQQALERLKSAREKRKEKNFESSRERSEEDRQKRYEALHEALVLRSTASMIELAKGIGGKKDVRAAIAKRMGLIDLKNNVLPIDHVPSGHAPLTAEQLEARKAQWNDLEAAVGVRRDPNKAVRFYKNAMSLYINAPTKYKVSARILVGGMIGAVAAPGAALTAGIVAGTRAGAGFFGGMGAALGVSALGNKLTEVYTESATKGLIRKGEGTLADRQAKYLDIRKNTRIANRATTAAAGASAFLVGASAGQAAGYVAEQGDITALGDAEAWTGIRRALSNYDRVGKLVTDKISGSEGGAPAVEAPPTTGTTVDEHSPAPVEADTSRAATQQEPGSAAQQPEAGEQPVAVERPSGIEIRTENDQQLELVDVEDGKATLYGCYADGRCLRAVGEGGVVDAETKELIAEEDLPPHVRAEVTAWKRVHSINLPEADPIEQSGVVSERGQVLGLVSEGNLEVKIGTKEIVVLDPNDPNVWYTCFESGQCYATTPTDPAAPGYRNSDGATDSRDIGKDALPEQVRERVMQWDRERDLQAALAREQGGSDSGTSTEEARAPSRVHVQTQAETSAIGRTTGERAPTIELKGAYTPGESVERVLQNEIRRTYPDLTQEQLGRVAHRVRLELMKDETIAPAFGVEGSDWSTVKQGAAYEYTLDRSIVEREIAAVRGVIAPRVDVAESSHERHDTEPAVRFDVPQEPIEGVTQAVGPVTYRTGDFVTNAMLLNNLEGIGHAPDYLGADSRPALEFLFTMDHFSPEMQGMFPRIRSAWGVLSETPARALIDDEPGTTFRADGRTVTLVAETERLLLALVHQIEKIPGARVVLERYANSGQTLGDFIKGVANSFSGHFDRLPAGHAASGGGVTALPEQADLNNTGPVGPQDTVPPAYRTMRQGATDVPRDKAWVKEAPQNTTAGQPNRNAQPVRDGGRMGPGLRDPGMYAEQIADRRGAWNQRGHTPLIRVSGRTGVGVEAGVMGRVPLPGGEAELVTGARAGVQLESRSGRTAYVPRVASIDALESTQGDLVRELRNGFAYAPGLSNEEIVAFSELPVSAAALAAEPHSPEVLEVLRAYGLDDKAHDLARYMENIGVEPLKARAATGMTGPTPMRGGPDELSMSGYEYAANIKGLNMKDLPERIGQRSPYRQRSFGIRNGKPYNLNR